MKGTNKIKVKINFIINFELYIIFVNPIKNMIAKINGIDVGLVKKIITIISNKEK